MRHLRRNRVLRRQLLRWLQPRPTTRRIVLHIGPHKTGSTYIQRTIEANRPNLPANFETVSRHDRRLQRLKTLTSDARNARDAARIAPQLTKIANGLARRFGRVEHLLISHEDLCGPMPGRAGILGLYPLAHLMIPAIVKGLAQSGAQVQLVFYKREFSDWRTSLYRYLFRDNPERGYHPRRFAERVGLPPGWPEFIKALRLALPEDTLNVVSYEEDRESGLLGRALFARLGLTDAEIEALHRLPPQNVSRPETLHDHQFRQ